MMIMVEMDSHNGNYPESSMHLLTHKPDKIGSAIQEAKEFFVYRVADNTIPDNPRQTA
jgi:hypothetical protein